MQYWINHNGVQSGPMDLDGLKQMGLTSDAYVWHEGLSDWVKITQLPELAGVYVMAGTVTEPSLEPPVEPIQNLEEPSQNQNESVTSQPYQPQQPPQQQPTQTQQQPYQPQYAGQQPGNGEPCPPTNLVWAIITTILCCLPAGVVAIVYATKVTNKYQAGDIEGAKRASETGAWWCIAAIILGIILQPLVSLLPSMMGN